MSEFAWVADQPEPPARWDLRLLGWTLSSGTATGVCLVDARRGIGCAGCLRAGGEVDPAGCIFLGVESGPDRARLLQAGGGDALPAAVALRELGERARRVAASQEAMPRQRRVGPVTLDLFHRDAQVGGRWLALHPREFGLLWRLAQRHGERVSRASLLRDVWRLDFEPGTNRVEVHVSRLRSKLAAAGVDGLVETDSRGGYRVAGDRAAPGARPVEICDETLCPWRICCYAGDR